MDDYIQRALAFNGQVKAYAIRSTKTVGEAQRRHDVWPTASAALGRAMSATAMMGAMLKGNDKITVKIEGRGPIGAIIVDADGSGHVRGYVGNPHVHFDLNKAGKLDVARAVGTNGFLSVIKDLGMRENFTGQVPLVTGEIGDDFLHYFVTSEQIPSAVGVGVIVNPDNTIGASGGFIIQMMPEAEEETISQVETHIQEMAPVSALVRQGLSPEQLLHTILGQENVQLLDHVPLSYQCHCSEERLARAIISLGSDEIERMIEEEGETEAFCDFCRERYFFNREALLGLKHEAQQDHQ